MPAERTNVPVKLSLPLVRPFYELLLMRITASNANSTYSKQYQQDIFTELRGENELIILARGLGLLRLVTNLLHFYDAAGNNLVLVVGADDRENEWIGEGMLLDGGPLQGRILIVSKRWRSIMPLARRHLLEASRSSTRRERLCRCGTLAYEGFG